VTIAHIPPNDWAAVGARLEKCDFMEVEKYPNGWIATVSVIGGSFGSNAVARNTPLAALTAALDAAEGKQQ